MEKPTRSELVKLKKLTCRAVAKKYGVSHGTAHSWLVGYGLNKSHSVLSQRNQMMRQRYREGLRVEVIADEFGVSTSTVSLVCVGIKRRNPAQKSVGCEKCEREPYARGLCKACYNRQWRNLKKSQQTAKTLDK